MRHSRVPLTPELKEALEVAYVSRIMSKNFRKEGQPEKERIARITGMDLDKVCFDMKSIPLINCAGKAIVQIRVNRVHASNILENVEHCGGEPEQAVNMHMNRLSFTLK